MELGFRDLTADDVECRVATVSAKGCSLLLYKNARCDMAILDETVGALGWQRSHSRDNANCTVSIWDDAKNQWISKEDTGTESYTEKEKGLPPTVLSVLVLIGASAGSCTRHHLFGCLRASVRSSKTAANTQRMTALQSSQ